MKPFNSWQKLPSLPVNALNLTILSAAMVFLIFILQGDAGFNIQDEGFLWYGTIRTALGEIPIRDFQSYDPGRYYWGAFWFKLLRNDGIMALRISQAAFQFIGLTTAFLLVRRVTKKWLPVFSTGLLLIIWMFPPWKIYEPVITIVAIYFAVLLIENPSKLRHLLAGVFVGFAAFFGRNHGVYCVVAFALLVAFVRWKLDRRDLFGRFGSLSLGVVIGYLPMLVMLALVPGFFRSFVDAILFNVHVATNLPLPVPWPWVPRYSAMDFKMSINQFAAGVAYLAIPAFYLLAVAGLLFKPKLRANNLFVASTLVGIGYLHYIFERPHLYYLAWTIPPFIIGLVAAPYSFSSTQRRKASVIAWSCLVILSFTVADMAQENFFLIKVKGAVREKILRRYHVDVGFDMQELQHTLVKTDIRGDHLWVTRDVADAVNAMSPINQQIAANEGLLMAPYWTGLYPILRKKSPTWEIYFLFPQPLSKQQQIVEDLDRNHVNWALVCHHYLDERPELAFEHTHYFVWQYLVANFERVPVNGLIPECEMLRRSSSASSAPPSPATSPTPALK